MLFGLQTPDAGFDLPDINGWVQLGICGGLLTWLVTKYLPKLADKHSESVDRQITLFTASLKEQRGDFAALAERQRGEHKATVERICDAHEKTFHIACSELRDEMKSERELILEKLAEFQQKMQP